ncbi:hypothetical protein RvY_01700 [Ramazzottius varieornatus]|uniref:Hexosyltransferase n=1 Tax=Ramazzottius varieornatus TaxID=947166 RepID=A0A1D1UHB1_RAMVA|nr:hypothetical protein RvY_01700 [Ramazzottius varieornatus]
MRLPTEKIILRVLVPTLACLTLFMFSIVKWENISAIYFRPAEEVKRVQLEIMEVIGPDKQDLAAWERLAGSELDLEETRWIRYLLMEPQETVIFPDNTKYLLTPSAVRNRSSSTEYLFIIFTHSAVSHFKMRTKVRETWADTNYLRRTKSINFFVMGSPAGNDEHCHELQANVTAESELYQDILQGDFIDTYRNLTLKHRLALRFLSEECNETSYRFAFKTDDDIVLDVIAFAHYMTNVDETKLVDPERSIYCAHTVLSEITPRVEDFKWYIKPEEYAGQKYPTFCIGNAYLLTSQLPTLLYDMSFYTKPLWVDDAYFSGLVAYNVGNVSYVQLPGQFITVPIQYNSTAEALKAKKWLVHTWQNPDDFDRYHLAFHSRHDLDIREQYRKSLTNISEELKSDDIFEYLPKANPK